MTLYGIDVAKYQAGMSLAKVKAEGFSWVEARASTGYLGGSVDTAFHGFKTSAADCGLLFVAYHFLYSSRRVSIAHQAAVCAGAIGDTRCPVMIDHETADGTGTPSVADAVAFADAMRAKGYRVPLWYLPHWVWQQMGSPRLPNTGMALVASSYVAGHGYASSLYPGAGSWPGSYGGLRPAIWQFTDTAEVAGHSVDADAFEGTYAELRTLLDLEPAPAPKPAPPPVPLSTIPGDRMILVEVDSATVPKGTPWPGYFTFNGSTLAHVEAGQGTTNNLANLLHALNQGAVAVITYKQYKRWGGQ